MPKRNVEYSTVVLPEPKIQKKDHSNYSFRHRRAEMLRMILAQGHSDLPNTQLAALYGVCKGQIAQDKVEIIKYISKHYLRKDRIVSDAIAAKHKALRESIKIKDWKTVNIISNDILKMCFDMGLIEKKTQDIMLNQTNQNTTINATFVGIPDAVRIVRNVIEGKAAAKTIDAKPKEKKKRCPTAKNAETTKK